MIPRTSHFVPAKLVHKNMYMQTLKECKISVDLAHMHASDHEWAIDPILTQIKEHSSPHILVI